MSKYAVTTTTATVTVTCPACGEKRRAEVRRSASAGVSPFSNPSELAAKTSASRDARSQVDSVLARIEAGDEQPFTERDGVKLKCPCGYESVAETFSTYFICLAAGALLAFVGIGVLIAIGGTIWYFRRRGAMDTLLAAGRARRRLAAG